MRTAAGVVVGALLLGACTGPSDVNGPPTTGTTARPSGPPSGSAADLTAPLGAKYDWSRFDVVSPYLKNLSGSSTFYELVWCDIEPTEGKQDWATMDAVARKAKTVGAQLMIKIRVGSCWATTQSDPQHVRGTKNKTESFMPKDMSKYNAFVSSVVKRYSAQGVHTYAVENEINSESFWGGSTAEFESLAKAAAASIRAADPAAAVADPRHQQHGIRGGHRQTPDGPGQGRRGRQGLEHLLLTPHRNAWRTAPVRHGRGEPRCGSRLLPQAARNLEYLALAEKLQKDKVVDIRQVHFYESWQAAPAFVDYLKATTPAGMPIEAWEVGQFLKEGTLTDEQRAQEMVKTVSLLLAGGVRRVLWLPLVMNPVGRNSNEPRYGLLNPDGSTRLTGTAFTAMAQAAAGATATAVSGKGLSGGGPREERQDTGVRLEPGRRRHGQARTG